MSRAPLDDNGEPLLSLPHAQQPATPDVPSLVPDIDTSSYTSPAPLPLPQSRHVQTEPEFRRSTVPSSAASHWKRRARDDDVTSRSPSPTKRSKVSESTFANSYREQLQTKYGGCCACEVRYYLHAAHVIDKAVASDLIKLRRQGVVGLGTLGDFDNAICLCPADHAAFDARDPGLIIVPTYLEFFIDHERRWQEEMRKTSPPMARMPVLSSQYAAYCAGISGKEGTKGRYTAYMVVDYKEKGRIDPPWTFEWHGDPGAILWKAHRCINLQLGSLEPEPAHLPQLMGVRKQLRDLSDLQEAGDLEWKGRRNAYEALDSLTGGGPPPAGPSNYGGNSAQGDPAGNDQPPPPPSSGNPGAAGQGPYNPPFWNTLSLSKDAGVYPQIRGTKRKQADLNPGDNNKDTVHVAVSDADHWCKRAKPTCKTGASSQRPPEHRRQAYRWGGPTSSTEEIVRYWNAVFGHIYETRETNFSPP
ncbi:hypothetical protein GQ44DRAFT_731808 [Phaeosphaeriaceae sp. PMI808]|nr:hypothetical protein GQ44DRAFT_731808 [Phaeosphaeriaceae sp. PMI808]